MKKFAFSFVFIIFLGILGFYLILDKKIDFDSEKKVVTQGAELERYCLFKKGDIKIIDNIKFCIIEGFSEPIALGDLLQKTLSNKIDKNINLDK